MHSRSRRAPYQDSSRKVRRSLIMLLCLLLANSAYSADPLHVLLTNDDGYAAPGIVAVRQALNAAGYRVTVVAPRDQQSGSSMRVTMGSIGIKQESEHFWTVAGTPADSVSFAIQHLLVDDLPDIVVSGINFGQNLGANTNLSGTVGAAIMATQLGIPAIAVSAGLDLAEADTTPERFASTTLAFPRAAAFTVSVLASLERTRPTNGALLPPRALLNINYPALAPAAIKGVRVADLSRIGGFVPQFVETDPAGEYRIDLRHSDPRSDPRSDTDTVLFAAGYITLSVLDGYLANVGSATSDLSSRLVELLDQQTTP